MEVKAAASVLWQSNGLTLRKGIKFAIEQTERLRERARTSERDNEKQRETICTCV